MPHAIASGLVGIVLAVAAASATLAQSFPARRITIVVPFSPGTAFDLIARTLGQKVTERYGQPVIVDNKPGASGSSAPKRSPPRPPMATRW
jgi:tripartite-type tricarboxylate transporter receptor subunit TctC